MSQPRTFISSDVGLAILMREFLASVVEKYKLTPKYGVSWFKFYMAACCLLIIVNAIGWKNVDSTLKALSIFSMLFIAYWWFQFVSGMHALASLPSLRLVPRYRLALALLVAGMWFFVALLAGTFLLFFEWFFVSVMALAYVSSLSSEKERWYGFLLVSLLIIIATIVFYTIELLLFFRPSDGLFLKIQIAAQMWAVPAGMFALLGVTRTLPQIAAILWALWLGAIFFSKPILGMSFNDLLSIIYDTTSQTTTHTFTAFSLFCLMMYGLIGKSLDRSLVKLNERVGFKFKALDFHQKFSLQGKSVWQLLPGFDYFLSHTLKRPFSFQPMLAFMFGRLGHWTSMLWYGLIIGLILCFWMYKIPNRHFHSDESLRLSVNVNLSFLAFLYVVSFANHITKYTLAAFTRYYTEHRILSLAPTWPNTTLVRHCLLMFSIRNTAIYLLIGALMIVACIAISGIPLDWMASLFWHPFVIVLSGALAMLIGLLKSVTPITVEKSNAGSTASRQFIVVLLLMSAPGMLPFLLRMHSIPVIFILESIAIIYCIILILLVRRFLNSDKKIFSVD
jgi:hypothetical protein